MQFLIVDWSMLTSIYIILMLPGVSAAWSESRIFQRGFHGKGNPGCRDLGVWPP